MKRNHSIQDLGVVVFVKREGLWLKVTAEIDKWLQVRAGLVVPCDTGWIIPWVQSWANGIMSSELCQVQIFD